MTPYKVLFVCTGNSARSILSEALLNILGGDRFQAFSAGSRPTGRVNSLAIELLQAKGIDTAGLSSKSWDLFTGTDAAALDIVVTVCDNAAREPCPVLFGDFVRTHWGLPDPAAVQGTTARRYAAFQSACASIEARIQALIELPLESTPREQWRPLLDAIGQCSAEARS